MMAEVKCARCDGEGWIEPIGPHSDGSYITSRPCPRCGGRGRAWVNLVPEQSAPEPATSDGNISGRALDEYHAKVLGPKR
jgi:hypothetical protein